MQKVYALNPELSEEALAVKIRWFEKAVYWCPVALLLSQLGIFE